VSKLVICRHSTRIESERNEESGEHTEIETCRFCGQIVKYYSFDQGMNKRRPSVLKFGRLGEDFAVVNPRHIINQALVETPIYQRYREAEKNTPAGSLVFNLPVVSEDKPKTTSPDALESKSEGTSVLTPGPKEGISQEMKEKKARRKQQPFEERMQWIRDNLDLDQVKKDFQTLSLAEFLKKYNWPKSLWKKLQPELGIEKKGRGKGKRSASKKKVATPAVPEYLTPSSAPSMQSPDTVQDVFSARLQAVASVLPALPAFDPSWSVLVQEQWFKTWSEALRYFMVYSE